MNNYLTVILNQVNRKIWTLY